MAGGTHLGVHFRVCEALEFVQDIVVDCTRQHACRDQASINPFLRWQSNNIQAHSLQNASGRTLTWLGEQVGQHRADKGNALRRDAPLL